MANKAGRLGAFYWGAATAVGVAETHGDLDFGLSTDFAEDTAHGDTWKTFIPTLSDFKVKIARWFDSSYYTLIDAAIARSTGKWYLYPDRTDATIYWYGTGYVSLDGFKVPLADTIEEMYSLVAATAPTFVHP